MGNGDNGDNIWSQDERCDAIDEAFKKEIGMSLHTAIKIIDGAGIKVDDAENIINSVRDYIAEDIEKRDIPYEYRFLLLNIIFCIEFKHAAIFYKRYTEQMRELEQNE